MRRRLILFAKPPVPGRVKTRLARSIGHHAAVRAYRGVFEDTLSRLRACCDADTEIRGADGRHPYLFARARAVGAHFRPQGRGDLGRRMHRAIRESLADGALPLIVGGDCAGITVAHVQAGFAALEADAEVVFAPAEDGGYALVGARRPVPEVFSRMPWGTSSVMRRTRVRLRRAGLHWQEIAPAWDLDDHRDLRRWRRQRARGAFGGPPWRRYP